MVSEHVISEGKQYVSWVCNCKDGRQWTEIVVGVVVYRLLLCGWRAMIIF
jgi:hypothetical protein